MSYQIDLPAKDRAASRFMHRVVRELQRAFTEEKKDRKITQQSVARSLGVNRSIVNRALAGRNLTLRTLGELIWALDSDYEFIIKSRREEDHASNEPHPRSTSASDAGMPTSKLTETGTNFQPSGRAGSIGTVYADRDAGAFTIRGAHPVPVAAAAASNADSVLEDIGQ